MAARRQATAFADGEPARHACSQVDRLHRKEHDGSHALVLVELTQERIVSRRLCEKALPRLHAGRRVVGLAPGHALDQIAQRENPRPASSIKSAPSTCETCISNSTRSIESRPRSSSEVRVRRQHPPGLTTVRTASRMRETAGWAAHAASSADSRSFAFPARAWRALNVCSTSKRFSSPVVVRGNSSSVMSYPTRRSWWQLHRQPFDLEPQQLPDIDDAPLADHVEIRTDQAVEPPGRPGTGQDENADFLDEGERS